MRKYIVIFVLFLLFVVGLSVWVVYPGISKFIEEKSLTGSKNSNQWFVTIKDPKFHVLQIPQPFEYKFQIIINGKS